MTRAKPTKRSALRNAEYYDFQDVLDKLYADSENGCQFQQLTELIRSVYKELHADRETGC